MPCFTPRSITWSFQCQNSRPHFTLSFKSSAIPQRVRQTLEMVVLSEWYLRHNLHCIPNCPSRVLWQNFSEKSLRLLPLLHQSLKKWVTRSHSRAFTGPTFTRMALYSKKSGLKMMLQSSPEMTTKWKIWRSRLISEWMTSTTKSKLYLMSRWLYTTLSEATYIFSLS